MQILETRPNGKPMTVRLSAVEELAHARYNELLDEGFGCITASKLMFAQYPSVSAAFIDWLIN